MCGGGTTLEGNIPPELSVVSELKASNFSCKYKHKIPYLEYMP